MVHVPTPLVAPSGVRPDPPERPGTVSVDETGRDGEEGLRDPTVTGGSEETWETGGPRNPGPPSDGPARLFRHHLSDTRRYTPVPTPSTLPSKKDSVSHTPTTR